MARPTMKTKIETPGGGAPGHGIECTLRLIAATVGDGVGYVTGSDVTIGGVRRARPDSDGVVSFPNVRPNSGSSSDVITAPTGTVYELTTRYHDGRKTVETFVAPDTAGNYWVQDYVTPAPGDLPALMAATAVTFAPTGDLAATTVAAALAELDSEKLPKAGGTMTGPLFVDDWTETTGETPDGWPLVPFPDATHRPPFIFRAAAGNHWAAYEHRGHVVFAILDTVGVTPAGANAWVPELTIGAQPQNGITFPNAWRFNNDPTAQGSLLNPIDSGIRTGNGTGERLTAGPGITRAVGNTDVLRTTAALIEALVPLSVLDTHETYVDHGNAGASETVDLAAGNVHELTLDQASCALTLTGFASSATSSSSLLLVVRQDGTGGRAISWPAAVKWHDGTPPTLSTGAGDVDVFAFFVVGGEAATDIFGTIVGQGFA